MKKQKKTKKPIEREKGSSRASLTTGGAASHCHVTSPAIKNWIREGKLKAFRTPGGHSRIEIKEFQRFLREHGMPPYPAPSPEPRILIVDDEPEIVSILADFLTSDPRGFKIETATDGYVALVKVGDFKPTVLILDVVIPQIDGVEVCRRLKADPGTHTIKILGITGYPDMIPALLEAGADACLTKPLDLPLVRQELEGLLDLFHED